MVEAKAPEIQNKFVAPRGSANKVKLSWDDKAFEVIKGTFLFLAFVIVVFPLLYIVASSFSSPEAVSRGEVFLWPVEFSLVGYKKVLENPDIWTGYGNSLFYMVTSTTISVITTVCAAFVLSRKELPGRKIIMKIFTFTLLFGGGIIPLYMVVKGTIGINNRLCMILPNAISIWNLIVARTFFMNSIPEELFDAAQVDGCNYFRYFISIVTPLSKSIIAILTLLFALANWNSYLYAFVFLSKKELYPLQIVLRNILIASDAMMDTFTNLEAAAQSALLSMQLKYALIVVASVPVLLLYPFVQKHMVKGVMIGSVKG